MASRAAARGVQAASVLLLLLLVAGCGKTNNPRSIDAEAFEDETGQPWPLTVDRVTVQCDPETKSVYVFDPETTNSYIVGPGRLEVFTKQIAFVTEPGADVQPLREFGLGLEGCGE